MPPRRTAWVPEQQRHQERHQPERQQHQQEDHHEAAKQLPARAAVLQRLAVDAHRRPDALADFGLSPEMVNPERQDAQQGVEQAQAHEPALRLHPHDAVGGLDRLGGGGNRHCGTCPRQWPKFLPNMPAKRAGRMDAPKSPTDCCSCATSAPPLSHKRRQHVGRIALAGLWRIGGTHDFSSDRGPDQDLGSLVTSRESAHQLCGANNARRRIGSWTPRRSTNPSCPAGT